ncbi:MAG: serine/threonine-protein kinase [Archangium sp.]|nr:serine/threonine-protein kinase [Archangium sp.]MDP3153086.1 serine/threonine-protein kinase [Archangium sp.]MDP3572219.1 serine/threonine-protein kinase [Archangium sp.]
MRGTNSTQTITTDPLIGTRLGEYDVLEAVGEGGMGVVYRGVQPVIKKRVAIKVLKPNMAGDATQVRRLADEAVAVNSIRHRNIIDIFSFGMLPDGRPYIVMEFLEGQPLDAYLNAHGRLPLAETISLLIAMCAPLAAAHRAGVIHRDLKPSNIFVCLSADGERYLKLLDFGLAKKGLSLDGTTEQTSRAQVTGTPNYMAPEQARGQNVSGRTDLYALGVIAYELVTGELPYSAPAPMEVLMQHVSSPIPQARVLAPECPEALEGLISRLLEKHSEDRPQTAEEVRAELIVIARMLDASPSYEAMDPVSGEYVSRAYKPLMTPDGLKPLSQMSVDLHAATFVSQRALKERRWPYVAGLVAVCLVLIAAIFSVSGEERVKPVVATPAPKVDPPVVPVAPVPAPVVIAPPPAPAPVVEPTPPTKVVRAVKTPPTAPELKKRVAALETALARATPEGEDPDPSALTLLRKYKVEATMLNTAEDRQRLADSLKAFEQTFLRR